VRNMSGNAASRACKKQCFLDSRDEGHDSEADGSQKCLRATSQRASSA
jgi:hypothetical protein